MQVIPTLEAARAAEAAALEEAEKEAKQRRKVGGHGRQPCVPSCCMQLHWQILWQACPQTSQATVR